MFCKVIIIGQCFDKVSGGGITLSNLFSNWDKGNIAVASPNIDVTQKSICTHFYQIGNDEEKWRFPLNHLQRKIKSGPINLDVMKQNADKEIVMFTRPRKRGFREFLRVMFLSAVHLLGVYNILYKLEVSDKFITWIRDYNPDIIYTQLSSLALIRFVNKLHQLLGIPIVIHIMDDWPSTVAKKSILSTYWRKILDKELRLLINKASLLMSICQAMSNEYKIRYGKEFVPFHNPVELTCWNHCSKTDWVVNGAFRILYAGRIGLGTYTALLDIVKAVESLSKNGYNIILEIQSSNISNQIRKHLQNFSSVKINAILRYKELPSKLSSMDLLVMPIDFNPKGLEYIRLSMPTKTTEYMASGTPILVYAPEGTALCSYAYQQGWGYVVNKRNMTMLCNAIKQLYANISLRERLGKRALELVHKKHDADKLRKHFYKLIRNCVLQRNKEVSYD